MPTYLEGLDAALEPCTLALLVPAIGLVLTRGSGAWRVWVGYVLGAAVMFWSRASGRWNVDERGAAALIIAGLVGCAFWFLWARSTHRSAGGANASQIARAGADDLGFGALVGAIAGWLWLPCVGTQLGIIINDARSAGARTLGMTVLYVAGAATIAALLVIVPVAAPAAARWLDRRGVRSVGLAFGVVFGGLIAIGQYDDVLNELLRRSSP